MFNILMVFVFPVFSQQKKFIDPTNMDQSVKPGDNFYLYVNGNWLKNNTIPASKTSWGSFAELTEESVNALRELLEESSKHPGTSTIARRVGDFYTSAMDSLAIEKKGYLPIKPFLDKINNLKSKTEVLNMIAWLRANAISSPFINLNVRQDSRNVSRYIIGIGQGGTSLPDRDYYIKNDNRSRQIQYAFMAFVMKMFTLTGETDINSKMNAQNILDFETILAKAQLSRVEMRDPVKLYNMLSMATIRKTAPHYITNDYIKKLGFQKIPDSIVVTSPSFLAVADSVFQNLSLDSWKAYLKWNVIKDNAPYLSSDFVNSSFQFNQVLTGQKELSPRWQRMSNLIDKQLGDLLGQLYVQKHFKPEAKKRMGELVKNMQETFAERIKQLDWMSDETKLRALQKLNAYVNKIGYADKWKDYIGIVITKDDFIANVRSSLTWQYKDMLGRLNRSVDKSEWGMTPPTVNAYYSPQRNEIVFPAGILRFPFFDPNADDAINYGGIAAVIGHEMTHGFDDQGRQYDYDGNLLDWWTVSDADKFKMKADEVVAQYNGFTVLDTLHVNGKLTLGENIADLGGLSIAYAAFKKTDQGKNGDPIDGFTPDQRFFINWAQIWRNNMLPETVAQRILTDNHSPSTHRTNGPLTNFDAWYKAFNIQETDKMYKAPALRTRIW
ncbi:MAG: M13 family metallopeptidase [Ferruginibacter sp.]